MEDGVIRELTPPSMPAGNFGAIDPAGEGPLSQHGRVLDPRLRTSRWESRRDHRLLPDAVPPVQADGFARKGWTTSLGWTPDAVGESQLIQATAIYRNIWSSP